MAEKAQIYTVFFGKPASKQGWPYQGFDCESRAQQLFQQLEQQCPQLKFKGGDLITTSEPEIGAEQIEKIQQQKKTADGCLYYLLALPPFQLPGQVLEGKPAILANDLYEALAYSQLLNEALTEGGLVGTCEADLDALLVQLIGQYLTGRPGFISDPVLDLGRNQIVYAHCVAPTKVQGEQGKASPSVIRSHSESGESAALQVFYPKGKPVTTVGLNLLEQKMVVHQGQIVDNIDQRKGCRTKVAVEADLDTILNNWDYQTFGWHRVSFCGKFREQFKKIATLLELELIEEDK